MQDTCLPTPQSGSNIFFYFFFEHFQCGFWMEEISLPNLYILFHTDVCCTHFWSMSWARTKYRSCTRYLAPGFHQTLAPLTNPRRSWLSVSILFSNENFLLQTRHPRLHSRPRATTTENASYTAATWTKGSIDCYSEFKDSCVDQRYCR